jgi:hypothetical protein
MASKKAGINKSAFVRTMPSAKPADVVAAAKAKGIKLTASLVYAVRSTAKTKKTKDKPGRKSGPKPNAASVDGGSVDQIIHRLAWTHGLAAVEASIKKLRAEVGG